MKSELPQIVGVRIKLRATLETEKNDVNSYPESQAVIVQQMNDVLINSGCPNYNSIGAGFFTKWIWATLETRGVAKIYDGNSDWGEDGYTVLGEMNDLHACFTVSDVAQAIAVIKELLAEESLLTFAEIGWRDNREGIFRTAYPENSPFCFHRHFSGAIGCPVADEL